MRSATLRLVLAVPTLAALLGFAAGPSEAALPSTTFVYVHDASNPPRVFGFVVEANGVLTPTANSPYTEPDVPGSGPNASNGIAASAADAVVMTAGGTGISTWKIFSDGSLHPVAGSPFAYQVHQPATSVQTVTVGARTFAYATQYNGGSMDGFEVAANGTLTRLAGFPLTGVPGISTLAAAGNKLVYANEITNSLRSYAVQADGSVKAGAKKPTKIKGAGSIYYVALDPLGKFAFTGGYTSGGKIAGFKVKDPKGSLAAAGGKTKPGLLDLDGGISISSTGLVAAFTGDGGADTQTFQLSSKGKLKKLGTAQSSGLAKVTSSAFSPDGTILVEASTASGGVASYSVDATTGVLTPASTQAIPFAANLNGVVVVHVQFADR
jgi:6-phosphogluconolactonase (cycloisomerase 2 family)